MFNFLVMMQEGKTVALLTGGGYNVTFVNTDRNTTVRSSVSAVEDDMRLSVCKHVHSDLKVGAASQQFDGVTYIN